MATDSEQRLVRRLADELHARAGLEADLISAQTELSEVLEEKERLRRWVEAENATSISERIGRLEAEKGRRLALWRLRRFRARKWWRLGGVLGSWRRQPWRLDQLVRDSWSLIFTREPLPEKPDLSRLEAKQARLREQLEELTSRAVGDLAEAKAAYTEGNYERCLELLEEAGLGTGASTDAHLLARNANIRLGEFTRALTHVRQALLLSNDKALRRQARSMEGRLRETDPNWLPTLENSRPSPRVTTSNRVVLHLLKESLPYFERGYTVRSQMSLMAQQRAGLNPVVVTSLNFPRDQGFEDFPLTETIDGVPHHRIDMGATYTAKDVPFDQILSDQAMLTARIAEDVRPAVIQAGSGYRGYETALVGLAVARWLEVPLIYEIRSFLEHTWTGNIERSETGEYYERRFKQEVRCLTEADLVITIAESMREEIIGRGISPEKVAVVPNVVDVTRFTPRKKSSRLLSKYGLGGAQVIGYISNLGAREGIDNLIRAVAVLRESGHKVAGLVVGDGPETPALENLISELGLEGKVVLTGHVPNQEIEDHYALIDVFIVPRIDDRAARLVTPLKPLEAMAMGIPVIASNLPALCELVEPGNRGLTYESGDPSDLARVAEVLLSDAAERSRLAANAREWVLSERTVEANAKRYDELIGTLLEDRS